MKCYLSGTLEFAASRLFMFESKVERIQHCWYVHILYTMPAICLITDYSLYTLPLGIDRYHQPDVYWLAGQIIYMTAIRVLANCKV